MDEFCEPFLNLHQLVGWAETRDPEAVTLGAKTAASFVDFLAFLRGLAIQRLRAGDDVNEWLWTGSAGVAKQDTPLPAFVQWIKHFEKMDGPQLNKSRPFPTLKYLEHLFRNGELKATAEIPGKPTAYELAQADWAGVEIAASGLHEPLRVWSAGEVGKGAPVFKNVRVRREDALRKFPKDGSPSALAKHEALLRQVIAENANPSGCQTKKISLSKTEATAEFLGKRFGSPSSMKNDELLRLIAREAPEIGTIRARTLTRSKKAAGWTKRRAAGFTPPDGQTTPK